jgi:LmbE family N-acetylglucosaminyl deacetylase
MERKLKLLILGAHPDDAEFAAGGLSALYRRHGHEVKMVSVTNGESGHHLEPGPRLVERRRAEAARSAAVIGAQSEVWDFPDGQLLPTLDVRHQIIRAIRTYAPDLVLTHRPNDYHPDHRAVGQAVQDASYMLTVPNVVRDVPILRRDPIVGYLPDRFTKPTKLQADVVIDASETLETVVDMLACHESQLFEWLPFNHPEMGEPPTDPAARRLWLRNWVCERFKHLADLFRSELVDALGPERGEGVEFAQVFEISEYAAPLDLESRQRLFGFLA